MGGLNSLIILLSLTGLISPLRVNPLNTNVNLIPQPKTTTEDFLSLYNSPEKIYYYVDIPGKAASKSIFNNIYVMPPEKLETAINIDDSTEKPDEERNIISSNSFENLEQVNKNEVSEDDKNNLAEDFNEEDTSKNYSALEKQAEEMVEQEFQQQRKDKVLREKIKDQIPQQPQDNTKNNNYTQQTNPGQHVEEEYKGESSVFGEGIYANFNESDVYSYVDKEPKKAKKQIHYHQHKHLHEHDHLQDHKHDHVDEHKDEHKHEHKNNEEHKHYHEAKHEHKHKEDHKHKENAEHKHEHSQQHQHQHKNEHKHEHKHDAKHAHEAKNEHKHDHQEKHMHLVNAKHMHEHKNDHQEKANHYHNHLADNNHWHDHYHGNKHYHKHEGQHHHQIRQPHKQKMYIKRYPHGY